jgi:Phytanoyl-CoA dioxygenase (PhyH)
MKPALTHQTEQDLKRFFEDKSNRTLRYLAYASTIQDSIYAYRDEIHALQGEGTVGLPGFFARESLLEIGRRFDALIAAGRCIAPVKDRSHKLVGVDTRSLTLRDRASSVGLDDPLVSMPDLVPLAFDSRLLGMATAYFQTVPMLSYVKVRKTFVNAIPPSPTQHFHVDIGAYRIFKVLLYLNDVEPGGGPFCYVNGSHRHKFDGWESKRYSEQEVAKEYGSDRIVHYSARAGDAMVVESTGFHCGEKPRTSDRTILILNYTVHPEYGFAYPPVRIRSDDLASLPPYARAAADALPVVTD